MNNKLTIAAITFALTVTLVGCNESSSFNDKVTQPYSEMTATALVAEYNSFLKNIYPDCDIYTESLLPNGLTIDNGNKNWFTKLSVGDIFKNVPALIGESGNVYAYKGKIGKSKYFASGINLWSGNNSDIIKNHVLLQEKIINDLLDVENYQDNNIVVWSEDSDFESHSIANYVTVISNNEKSAGIENVDFDLFIGKSTSIETMEKVLAKGIPVIIAYNHYGWVNGDTSEMLGISYSSGKLESLVSGGEHCDKLTEKFQNTAIMLEHLVNDGFTISASTMPVNAVNGEKVYFDKISDPSSNKNLEEIFSAPVQDIRNSIEFYDNQGINILEQNHLKHLQIPIYLGDLYRKNIEYNGYRFYADIHGSAESVDYNQWFKTYFTDLTSHFARPDNNVNFDLGAFSPRENDIQDLPTFNTNFSYDLTTSAHITAVGVYVKAGQETIVKRTDTDPNDIYLYVNLQRDGATKLFGSGNGRAYDRPALDRSHGVKLAAGEEVSISSPIGGPLFVSVPNNSKSNQISFNIKNVLRNPVIYGVTENDIHEFESSLASTPFNWVTVITKEVQIHSIESKFEETLESYNNDVNKFMEDIITYTLGNFRYAGYLSNTLPDHTDSIKQFCSNLGVSELCAALDIHSRNSVQHIYVDRPTCGSMCSGNPYDRIAAYMPGDWGDSHEIGHNLQTSKLNIYNARSGEVSNNIFPVESRRLKAIELGNDTYDVQSNFTSTLELMKQGLGVLNSDEHPLWSGTGTYDNAFERLGFYNQLQFASRDIEFYTKIYLLQRIAEHCDNDSTNWEIHKNRLGFSMYTSDEFRNMNGNDFMAISSSMLIGKDVSQFFEGFGISISDKAKVQISSEGYTQSLGMGIYFVDYSKVPINFVTDPKDEYFIKLTPEAVFEDPTI